jgi:hypothetical protein
MICRASLSHSGLPLLVPEPELHPTLATGLLSQRRLLNINN